MNPNGVNNGGNISPLNASSSRTSQLKYWNCGGFTNSARSCTQDILWQSRPAVLGLGEVHRRNWNCIHSSTFRSYHVVWGAEPEPGDSAAGLLAFISPQWYKSYLGCERINPRILVLKFKALHHTFRLVLVYAPCNNSPAASGFYNTLNDYVDNAGNSTEIVILGDLNAKVERDYEGVTGRFSPHPYSSSSGKRLIEMCEAQEMRVESTFYSNPRRRGGTISYIHRNTGVSPSTLDHCVVQYRWMSHIKKITWDWSRQSARFGHLIDHAIITAHWHGSIKRRDNISEKPDVSLLRNVKYNHPRYRRIFDGVFRTYRTYKVDPAEDYANHQEALQQALDFLPRIKSDVPDRHVSNQYRELLQVRSQIYRDGANPILIKLINNTLKTQAARDYRSWIDACAAEMEESLEHNKTRKCFAIQRHLCGKTFGAKKSPPNETPEVAAERWFEFGKKKFSASQVTIARINEFFDSLPPPPPPPPGPVHPNIDDDIPEDDEWLDIFMKASNFKSPGVDQQTNECAKYSPAVAASTIRILDTIWDLEDTPSEKFSLCKLVPLYKKGDSSQRSNYRLVGLLNSAFKYLSSALMRRIVKYVGFPDSQSGFRASRGCSDNLQQVRLALKKLIENSPHASIFVLFLDFSSAFDTISHAFMARALRYFNVPPKTARLVELLYRDCRAFFSGAESNPLLHFDVNRGVIQGDALSPCIFICCLLCVMIGSAIPGVQVPGPYQELTGLEYADDILQCGHTLSEISAKLNCIATNSRNAGLEVNPKKTVIVPIGSAFDPGPTTEADVMYLNLPFVCPDCGRSLPSKQGLALHRTRWCDGINHRSRANTVADKMVVRKKQARLHLENRPDYDIDKVYLLNSDFSTSEIKIVEQEVYLGQTIDTINSLESELDRKLGRGAGKYNEIKKILKSRRCPHALKIRLVKVIVNTTILSSSETWMGDAGAIFRRLRHFSIRTAARILRKKPSVDNHRELDDYALKLGLADMFFRRKLRWFGHLCRNGGALGRVIADEDAKKDFFQYLPPLMRYDFIIEVAKDRRLWTKVTNALFLSAGRPVQAQ